MTSKRLIVIVGATASGKTSLSIRLARAFGAPIISTDSRQMYCGMAIGTAQPTVEELQTVEHHFVATLNPNQDFNCGEYEREALALLDKLFTDHPAVVAVGGSGLYVRALCEGIDDLPTADICLRKQLTERLQAEGVDALFAELARLDPAHSAVVDRHNPARVMRALEVCLQTGKPYSEQRKGAVKKRDFQIIKIGVDVPREQLYERIDSRVEQMIADGLEEEARALYPMRALNSLQTVGYREMFDYFDGLTTRERAVELIKRNTRHYAKRQLTWFRHDTTIRWFAPTEIDAIVDYINSFQ